MYFTIYLPSKFPCLEKRIWILPTNKGHGQKSYKREPFSLSKVMRDGGGGFRFSSKGFVLLLRSALGHNLKIQK